MKTRWCQLDSTRSAVLLFSGGFDSTYVGSKLMERGIEVFPLTFEYQNRPRREAAIATEICKEIFNRPAKVIDLDLLDYRNDPKSWSSERREGWIPYRNIIFFSIAAHFALTENCQIVAAGVRTWDTSALSDATPEYFKSLEESLLTTGDVSKSRGFEFFLPIIEDDREIEGNLIGDPRLNSLLQGTWSCWRDQAEPCGQCAPCRTRNEYLVSIRTKS